MLTHHVVPETLTPDNLAGTFETLNKDELVVEGEGEMFVADAEEQASDHLRQHPDGQRQGLRHRRRDDALTHL